MRSELSPRDRELLDDLALRPRLLLLGCQPFVRCEVIYQTPPPIDLGARRGELHSGSHVRDRRPEFASYTAGDVTPCPACHDQVVDRASVFEGEAPTIAHCLRCSGMDARHNARLGASKTAAEIKRSSKEACEANELLLRRVTRAAKRGRVQLGESERRRIWCGNRRSLLAAQVVTNNLAASGRAFLVAIDQCPNFDRILDARGKIVGYWSDLEREAARLLAAQSQLNVEPDRDPD